MKADVTNIKDDRGLEEKAAALLEMQHVSLAAAEQTGNGTITFLSESVRAVLVTERNEEGGVEVTGGNETDAVYTSPRAKPISWIIIVKKGQSCAILGDCKFRCFA